MRASITRLQNAGKTVIAQREEWKARALVAELMTTDLTAQLADRWAKRDDRFDALRRLVARELHPDHCAGGDIEKTVRAEFSSGCGPRSSGFLSMGRHDFLRCQVNSQPERDRRCGR